MKRLMPMIALPLLTLAACDVDTKTPKEGDNNVSINASDSGKVSFDLPFAKGEVDLPPGFMSKGEMDIDGVKLMPGSKPTGFSVMSEGEGSVVNIGFSAPQAPDAVSAYFVDAFGKQGGKASIEGNAVKATTKDGDAVTITIDPADTGSTGMIAIKSTEKVN